MQASRPATRQDLFARFDELAIPFETVEHEAKFTVADCTGLDEEIPGGHTKNLFLKCKKGQLFLVVALNDAKIALNQLHKRLESGRLSFGSAELLTEVLGVYPGSVTPFALINDNDVQVRVVLDEPMMRFDRLNFHPLENTATTRISRDDLIRFIHSCGHDPHILPVSDI